eukprot:14305080-Heterocapsa_arctica.AAC.1
MPAEPVKPAWSEPAEPAPAEPELARPELIVPVRLHGECLQCQWGLHGQSLQSQRRQSQGSL